LDKQRIVVRPIIIDYVKVTSTLVATAFGVAAGIAWSQTVSALFLQVFGTSEGLIPNTIYAIIITVIAVTVTLLLARAASKMVGEEVDLGLGGNK